MTATSAQRARFQRTSCNHNTNHNAAGDQQASQDSAPPATTAPQNRRRRAAMHDLFQGYSQESVAQIIPQFCLLHNQSVDQSNSDGADDVTDDAVEEEGAVCQQCTDNLSKKSLH